MAAKSFVESPLVRDSKLLTPKSVMYRPYTLPFVPLYATFFHLYFTEYERYIGGSEWTFVFLGTIMSLNILVLLMPAWNVKIAALFNFTEVDNLNAASDILIFTTPNNGADGIVEIQRVLEGGALQTYFQFQKKRFLWSQEEECFSCPKFAIDESPKIKDFKDVTGLKGDLTHLVRLYGKNTFDIPIPSFMELFKEHAVAPLFVFQVFCVALWLLDEFWYYSLFNLFMIVSMEAAGVFQRLTALKEFRTMGITPYSINVYRNKKWVSMTTDELLPMDVVSVTRTAEDSALPCDLVMINGTCIVNEAMLSGESTPLLKESIKLRDGEDDLQINGLDKNAILHGGTKVLQATAPETASNIPLPPDNGCLAVVSKTGFETSQGSLVRVMIFSSERVSVDNKEALMFILFLLIFAVIASWYVWIEGTKMGRIQSKLILDCILIITSVVPPELPMELTMAVNSSLAALSKFYVYCTEPFRIPFAGRIDVCCFDKTGTLTGEDLVFEGLAGLSQKKEDIHHLATAEEAPKNTNLVIGAAHSLVKLDDGETVGDPMEKATLRALKWKVQKNEVVTHNELGDITIMRRFQFSSALKRSSSIASHESGIYAAVKGAPETIRERLVKVPANYDEIYKSFTRSGSRVLALASKSLSKMSQADVDKLKREKVECDLKFDGFLIFHCPLKDDAIETIQMLNESGHRSIMITGDNPLTAVHVAKEVGIVEGETLICDKVEESNDDDNKLVFRNVQETISIPFDPSTDKFNHAELFDKYEIAVTGYALNALQNHDQLRDLIRHAWVYARVSPTQKEFLLNTLKEMGYQTLMCGDGTNDVGALKQAHVGVALLNGTEESLNQVAEQRKIDGIKMMYEKQCTFMQRWGQALPVIPEAIAHLYPPGSNNPHYLTALEKKGTVITDEIRKFVADMSTNVVKVLPDANGDVVEGPKAGDLASMFMDNAGGDGETGEAPTLKLGDASCAAPFTSKLANVSAVTNIIRQGRCALVNTIQMYKILALNCLISAYSLSIIYMAGVKFGDGQATASGLLLSVCFLSISRGKPLQKLSKQRPQAGIFNIYIMGSILSQFAIHIATLIYITMEIYKLEPREPKVDLEKEFAPSLLNTGIFIIQLVQQVSTFAVNYQGEPFREDIRHNKGMYYGLVSVSGLALASATEFMPELNEAMKFVPMNDTFKFKLTTTLLLDFFGSLGAEHFFKYFFMDDTPADITVRKVKVA
ncbi:ion-transporting P-type ATPase [Maudiozyma humilis]|uniref:Ion-transporting P-type ATPase n=1 Tax=Maudiozyma humilis TaxID=51915 RepID=A0AAV5S103_MAUHU|nr:ion-transporting P-type ATPase [Kazachstania humilis]